MIKKKKKKTERKASRHPSQAVIKQRDIAPISKKGLMENRRGGICFTVWAPCLRGTGNDRPGLGNGGRGDIIGRKERKEKKRGESISGTGARGQL